jgi:hypothetical protein
MFGSGMKRKKKSIQNANFNPKELAVIYMFKILNFPHTYEVLIIKL